jgi:hypothetical protein
LAVEIQSFGAAIHGFTIADTPGSIDITASAPPGGAANVVFTTGRCFILVGQGLTKGKPSARRLAGPVIEGAKALYTRASGVCS